MKELSPEVLRFARLMQARYDRNKWRGEWREDKARHHVRRCLVEWHEFQEAFHEVGDDVEAGDIDAITYVTEQAVDVAIFAMFASEVMAAPPEGEPAVVARCCWVCGEFSVRRVWERYVCASEDCLEKVRADWVPTKAPTHDK